MGSTLVTKGQRVSLAGNAGCSEVGSAATVIDVDTANA
jgi:hypothetical protein